MLINVFSGSRGAPDQQTEHFESMVRRSHGSRTAGCCSETETSLLSPPQAHHKAESRQARSPGEKGPELPLSGRIQHWEPLPGVHLEDRCNISRVHPASRACKQPPIPPCLGAGISSRSQPRCLQALLGREGLGAPTRPPPMHEGKGRTSLARVPQTPQLLVASAPSSLPAAKGASAGYRTTQTQALTPSSTPPSCNKPAPPQPAGC